MLMSNYKYYYKVLSRIKGPVSSITTNRDDNSSALSLESYMVYGIGSIANGHVLSKVACSNTFSRRIGSVVCPNDGLLACSQCCLVKYCSGRCQRQHWPKHRLDCEHPYLQSNWQPDWVIEKRPPLFTSLQIISPISSRDIYNNPGYPAYDCLRLCSNEGRNALSQNFKLCLTSAGDIRNIVETVNNLPAGYSGRLDILLNNNNSIILNRILVILCLLLSPGPSIEESAELTAHLMYSASLPETGAAYVRYCINLIYGEVNDGEMSFQTTLKTRGRGKLYSAQPAAGIKRILEMFSSTYSLARAMSNMLDVVQDPFRTDDRHKILSSLQPAHRVAMNRFWQTGVLSPFSMDLSAFKQPNRLMFSAQGKWLGEGTSDINPLCGWDVSAVRNTGLKHGLDPAGDILGCLFFHIKAQLREFSLRVKEFNIHIHLLQYDSRLLSKGISIGVLPAFSEASFDRVDIGDMSDTIGVAECLADWGTLLNKENRNSSVVMHSKRWHEHVPGAIARDNPRTIQALMEKCENVPSVNAKLKNILRRPQSPSLARLMSSLDAFIDHEDAFLQYLQSQEAETTGASLGICIRQTHRIHPKRVGVRLQDPNQKLPDLSKHEFYDLFTIGGADLAIRFAEFEFAPSSATI